MKYTRTVAALLALLLAGSALLSACTAPEAGTEISATTAGASGEHMTLGEEETRDPAQTAAPENTYQPPETLVGDGADPQGIFPIFSEPGGLYTEKTKTVTLTATEGYTVRYTVDGSLPTAASAAYADPIRLQNRPGEGTVLRAACFDAAGSLAGQVITQTYVCAESVGGLHYTVMLTCDEKDLNAMYRDVHAKVERAAHAEILAPDGSRIISQDVGLRLFGGSSRALAQKSFKIIARKDGYFGDVPYTGEGTFYYPFFPARTVLAGQDAGEVLTRYDSLILRNGGNDSLLATAADADRPTLLRDGMANEFIAKYAPHVQMSYAHFAVVYLNGEYYGILELRENQNEDYIKRLYGVDDKDVVVVKSELDTTRACDAHSNGSGCRFCGSWFFYETDEDPAAQKEMADWIALCQRAAGAVNAPEAEYRRVFEEVSAKLDLTNACEYLAAACYLCNTDWPHNNIRVWRYTGAPTDSLDGKWRFATRDMDFTMARYDACILPEIYTAADTDMFSWVLSNYVTGYGDRQEYTDALYLQGLFSFLMRDDSFRADFAACCRSLASDEATAYLKALYDDAYAQVDPIVSAHVERWSGSVGGMMSDVHSWRRATRYIERFIEDRPAVFLAQLDTMLSMYE